MVGSAAVLAVVAVLLTSGSHHKSSVHQVNVADVPKDSAPGTPGSSSPSGSPSPSASAKHHAAKHDTGKPKKTGTQAAGHDSTSTQHSSSKRSPSKKTHSGASLAPAASRLYGGSSAVLLHNSGTGLCADLPDYGKGKVNGPVSQYHCQGGDSDNQMWSLSKVSGKGPGKANLFLIRNTKDGLCMDLPDFGGKSTGTKVSEYHCDGSSHDNQTWYIWPGHGHHYQLRNAKSGGRCLGVGGGSGGRSGARLELRACGPSDTDWSW